MYISCIIGFALIFLYCAIITFKDKDIPNSISQIVYSLSEKWKWTFTLVMFLICFLIAPQLMTVATKCGYDFLGFLTLGGILGVGVDPLVKGNANVIHYTSAIVMGLSSQALVYIINPYLLFGWIPYILYTMYSEDGSKNMFLSEMVMLVTTNVACIL